MRKKTRKESKNLRSRIKTTKWTTYKTICSVIRFNVDIYYIRDDVFTLSTCYVWERWFEVSLMLQSQTQCQEFQDMYNQVKTKVTLLDPGSVYAHACWSHEININSKIITLVIWCKRYKMHDDDYSSEGVDR